MRSIVLERQLADLCVQDLYVDRRGGLGSSRGPEYTGRLLEKLGTPPVIWFG